jgi:Tol biopolymer transport system component
MTGEKQPLMQLRKSSKLCSTLLICQKIQKVSPKSCNLLIILGMMVMLLSASSVPAVYLSIDDVVVLEGDVGLVNAVFAVHLSATSEETVTAKYRTATWSSGAKTDTDFLGANGTLTFAPGEVIKHITIQVKGDRIDELDETFYVDLINVPTIGGSQGACTIVDDDEPPSLSIDDISVMESESEAVFTVSLSAVSGLDVSVELTINGNTATSGDYKGFYEHSRDYNVTWTFDPGEASKTISVYLNGDSIDEEDEIFLVNLSNAVNASIADGQGQCTILDDDDPPSLSIDDETIGSSRSPNEKDTGSVNAVFGVKLSSKSGKTITVNYATAEDTATAGSDYVDASGTLTFDPGYQSKTIEVLVKGDTLDEADEIFLVNLSNAVNASIADGQGQCTIYDDDDEPSLSIGDASVTEGDSAAVEAVFIVKLSEPSGRIVTVDYAAQDDTASAGVDYALTPGTLTFSPGETNQSIIVTIRDDTLDEDNEDFFVKLTDAANASIADSQGKCTILDDDDPPSLSIDDVSVMESESQVVFTVSLSAVSGLDVSVKLTISGNTATSGDYGALVYKGSHYYSYVTLKFDPGEASKTISVNPDGDSIDEEDEIFYVNLSDAVNATIADSQGQCTILDDDDPPSLSIDDETIAYIYGSSSGEKDAGTVKAYFTVKLSSKSGKTVTVDYATAEDTATAGTDYVDAAGTLTFDPGYQSKTIEILVKGDSLNEANEVFFVNLSNAVNSSITDGQGQCTIYDDDDRPSLSIGDASVTEGDSGAAEAVFIVNLSVPSGRIVTVDYAAQDDTASSGVDYALTPGTLTFSPGETNQSITVPIKDDTLDEDNEDFSVKLTNATNASIADSEGQCTILDDDDPPSLSVDDVSVIESKSEVVFTVSLSAVSDLDVSVKLTINSNTATSGDYEGFRRDSSSGRAYYYTDETLNLGSGKVSETISVYLDGDTIDEEDEIFFVDLSDAVNASIADSQGQCTILDDDDPPSLSIDDETIGSRYSSGERDAGMVNGVFSVKLSSESGKTITVDYATAADTATAGNDYVDTAGTLTFHPGDQSQTIEIPVKGDILDEADEVFYVNLSDAVNASITDGQGQCTIYDDDDGPSLSISDASVTEGDSGTTEAVFIVSLSKPSGRIVTVDYAAQDDTASSGVDYALTPRTLIFSPGETSKTIAAKIVGDERDEEDEKFTVKLSNSVNASLNSQAKNGVGVITDNDERATALSIIAPTNDQVLPVGTTTATLIVDIQDHKGIWHWKLDEPFPDSGPAGGNIVTSGRIATITGLNDGMVYTIYAILVDDSNKVLDPPITSSITFSVNDLPTLTAKAGGIEKTSFSVSERETLKVEFYANDSIPQDRLIVSTDENFLPENATFTSSSSTSTATATFEFEPDYTQACVQPFLLIVTVADSEGASVPFVFPIEIQNVNRPPEFDAVPEQAVYVEDILVFDVAAADPDTEDTLFYSATDLPPEATFDVSTGKFGWQPFQPGEYTVTFSVKDDWGAEDILNVPIYVSGSGTEPSTGSKIAFSSDRDGNYEIYVMNPDGSGVRNLTNDLADDNSPSWSPDGSGIAFESNRDGDPEIYIMDSDGGNQKNLTNNPAGDGGPSWSPDGTKIAFDSTLRTLDGDFDIYVMDSDGRNQVSLTNSVLNWSPAWSPDGTKIAFCSYRDGDFDIYVMDSDGGNLRNLTNNPEIDDDPAWSPDGTKIAFKSYRDGNSEIYVMDSDGRNQKNLTNNPANDSFPSWSPDGTKVAFSSDRDGNHEIYVMDSDGENQANLTNSQANDLSPFWSIGSPIYSPGPSIVVSPSLLNLEAIIIGKPYVVELVISNNGDADLSITGIIADLNIDLMVEPESPLILAPGDNVTLTLTFNASSEGEIKGDLTIAGSDPDSLTKVGITGVVVSPDERSGLFDYVEVWNAETHSGGSNLDIWADEVKWNEFSAERTLKYQVHYYANYVVVDKDDRNLELAVELYENDLIFDDRIGRIQTKAYAIRGLAADTDGVHVFLGPDGYRKVDHDAQGGWKTTNTNDLGWFTWEWKAGVLGFALANDAEFHAEIRLSDGTKDESFPGLLGKLTLLKIRYHNPSLDITSPSADEAYGIGSNLPIRWTSDWYSENVAIGLDTNGDGNGDMWIKKPTDNDGEHDWSIPSSLVDKSCRVMIWNYELNLLFGTGGNWNQSYLEYSSFFMVTPSSDTILIDALCPVDLIVTDPEGRTVSKNAITIPSAAYIEEDLNGDGDPDDRVVIPNSHLGDYSLEILSQADAKPEDTFKIEVSYGREKTALMKETMIRDIPKEPVIIRVKKADNGKVQVGLEVQPEDRMFTTWGDIRTTFLLQNYPNPFNPDTWIPYHLAQDVGVTITIHDATGHLIRTLDLGHRPADFYITKDKAAYWDGKNEAGEQVSSGVYFYTVQAGDFTATKKMVVAR